MEIFNVKYYDSETCKVNSTIVSADIVKLGKNENSAIFYKVQGVVAVFNKS